MQVRSFRCSTGQAVPAIEQWAEGFGVYNTNASGTVDYDGDGFDNAWEWGMLGNPNDASKTGWDPVSAYEVDATGTNVMYVYPRRENEPRLTYTLKETPNLQHVGFTDEEATYTITNGPVAWSDTMEMVTNSVPANLDTKFLKLFITVE